MFFRRSTATPPASTATAAPSTSVESANADFSALLDAFGHVLAAYAKGNIDLPGRPANEVAYELELWRRHSLLGAPVDDGDERAVATRDFGGAARVFSEQRRVEKRLTESVLTDLRECLWTCVQRVHVAVQADTQADSATALQVDRLRSVMQSLETGAIKDEVFGAISAMEQIANDRRAVQRASFAQLAEKIDELSTQLADARRESETDVLTGLGNRKRFEFEAARTMQLSTIGGSPATLIVMDLDNLKAINDSMGHAGGDTALQAFAGCLTRVFRGDSDVLCRLGGDEFVALLPHARLPLAERLSGRLVQTVSETLIPNSELSLGVSVGYAELQPGEEVASWLSRADRALYQAKSQGRGQAIAG